MLVCGSSDAEDGYRWMESRLVNAMRGMNGARGNISVVLVSNGRLGVEINAEDDVRWDEI
jgi:hypothetical protein